MSQSFGSQPDPARLALARTQWEPSTFRAVSEAMAEAASDGPCLVFIERLPSGWCWGFAHRGGPYPLSRVAARFLRVDHHKVQVGFRVLPDGVCVQGAIAPEPDRVDARLVRLGQGWTPGQVRRAVLRAPSHMADLLRHRA
jgi:hypothetical protein